MLATMTPMSWPFVKTLSWAADEVDAGIAEGVVAGVSDRDEFVEEAEEVGVIEEIDVAVLDDEIEAEVDAEVDKEVDKDVVGVAVVVKEGIAVVVSGVDATGVEAGEVEPPNVHSDPNGICSKKNQKRCNPV